MFNVKTFKFMLNWTCLQEAEIARLARIEEENAAKTLECDMLRKVNFYASIRLGSRAWHLKYGLVSINLYRMTAWCRNVRSSILLHR